MISSKLLIKLAKRRQKIAVIQTESSFPRLCDDADSCFNSSASVNQDHSAICTAGQKRFVVRLSYINNEIIGQLFNVFEKDCGAPSNGPTTLPCDSTFMDYIISLISRGLSREPENVLLVSITLYRCSSPSLHQEDWRNREIRNCVFADINVSNFCK